jgi:hypothetical protein
MTAQPRRFERDKLTRLETPAPPRPRRFTDEQVREMCRRLAGLPEPPPPPPPDDDLPF